MSLSEASAYPLGVLFRYLAAGKRGVVVDPDRADAEDRLLDILWPVVPAGSRRLRRPMR